MNPKVRRAADSPIIIAVTLLFLAGWACTLSNPTPVAWSRTQTPVPPPASPTSTLAASPFPSQTKAPSSTPNASISTPQPEPGPWLVYSRNGGKTITAVHPDGRAGPSVDLPTPLLWPGDLSIGADPAGDWLSFRTGQKDLAGLALTLIHLPDGKVRQIAPLLAPQLEEQVVNAKPGESPDFATAVTRPDAFAWSPDGRYLAFISAAAGLSANLYVYDTRQDKVRRLTNGPNQDVFPTWSPDSLWVVFEEVTSFQSGAGWKVRGVWASAVDHNEIRKLYEPPANSAGEAFAGWNGKGELVVYTRAPDAGRYARAIPISARYIDPLYAGPFDELAIDPRSQIIAFSEDELTGAELSLAQGVYLAGTPKGIPQTIQAGAWEGLTWSPSAGKFFAHGSLGLLAANSQGADFLLNDETWPAPSPDGLWLVCWGDPQYKTPSGVRLYRPEGGLLQEITADTVQSVLWRADSKGFFYLSQGNLYLVVFPGLHPALLDKGVQEGGMGWVGVSIPK
ncbi:MAG: hypothetical protein M1281_16810 [Chloroflexi bacterium]|nr:hypothetical protein [Chloroflexota bacterium]